MKNRIQIAVIVLFAILSRFLYLGLRPLDGDEGIVIKIAQSADLPSLLSAVAKDVHPPLFHFFEFLVFKFSPLSEFSARFLSALSGLLAIYFIFLVFAKIADKKTALAVAILSVINPILSYHFAEVRPYGLFVLVFFAQLYFFLKIKDGKKTKDIIWFSLLSFALIFTQYIGFLILAGEFLYTLALKRKAFSWSKVFALLGVLCLFVVLWGEKFVSQIQGRLQEQSQMLSLKDNLTGIFNSYYRFFSGRMFLDLDPSISKNLEFLKSEPLLFVVFVLSVIIPLGLFIWGLIHLYKTKKKNFHLILIIFTPVILAAIASSEIGPRASRYLLFLAPFALYALVKLYFEKTTTLKNIIFGMFTVLYIDAYIHGYYFERKKPGADVIAHELLSQAKDGDKILATGGFGGGESLVLKYYLGEQASSFEIYDLYSDYEVGNLDKIKGRKIEDEVIKLKNTNPSKSVWFYDFTYTFDADKASLKAQQIPLGRDKENKEIVLYKF